jgi:hypothetical protein
MLAMQTQAGAPLVPSVPISPEEGSRASWEGMKQEAHLARCARVAAVPVARLAQRTRTTVAHAGGGDHPETAILLSLSFMRNQSAACRTLQGSIGLKRNVRPGEAVSFPGGRGSGWSRPRCRRRGSRWDG